MSNSAFFTQGLLATLLTGGGALPPLEAHSQVPLGALSAAVARSSYTRELLSKHHYSLLGAIDSVLLPLNRLYRCEVYDLFGVPDNSIAGYIIGKKPTLASLLYGNWPKGYEILYTGHTVQSADDRLNDSHHKMGEAKAMGANCVLIYFGLNKDDVVAFERDVYRQYFPVLNDKEP